MPVPVAARSKASVGGLSLAGVAGSNSPPGVWMSFVSVVCCQVEVYASGRSVVQWSPTDCGVFDYDLEAAKMRRPCLTGGCCIMEK